MSNSVQKWSNMCEIVCPAGIEKDIKKAVELYQLAVDQGDASAQYNLGLCYATGDGVGIDLEKAVSPQFCCCYIIVIIIIVVVVGIVVIVIVVVVIVVVVVVVFFFCFVFWFVVVFFWFGLVWFGLVWVVLFGLVWFVLFRFA